MLRKLCFAACTCLFFWPNFQSNAQYPQVGLNGPIPVGPLNTMQDMLHMASPAQTAGLLVRLGIEPSVAEMTAHNMMPGQSILLRPVRAPGKFHYGAVFLPSGTGTTCSLYLLHGSDDPTAKLPWHVIGSQTLDCWFDSATLEVLPLRHADADDLVLHHVTEGHGSGYLAEQTQVFSVLNGKLVQTLMTRDFLTETTAGTGDTLKQKSVFLPFPGNLLEETRSTSVDSKLKKIGRRYWHWSPETRKFIASPFVQAIPPQLP